MRNLKKVLALVLALVMSLSLITIANAADFSDDADIDYDEAVDVMVAAGIIDGVGNNSFDPNGTLTREQAAKLITYMLLGENSEKLGVESSSFKDVAATRWSAPAIEYCATMGIIDGAGDGNFYPAGKLTGFAFAKMLLTALGYKSDREGFTGANWTINVATKALSEDVRLDAGLEKMFGSAELSRQEAAQMALNAICAPIVEYDGNSVEVNGTTINIGNTGARFVTTTIANQQSISTRKLTNSGSSNDKSGYTVELGEKYLPKLERRYQPDDFGRPAYTWSYDKKEVGTYLDDTDLVATYTTKVTGKDLYDAITKVNLDDAGDHVYIYIDGETDSKVEAKTKDDDETVKIPMFSKADIRRSNTDGVGGTEKGVLTQVFVQRDYDNDTATIIISVINTYLAIAGEDYDSKNEDVQLTVYALDETKTSTSKNPDYIKNKVDALADDGITVTVKNEDIDVEDVKEDDKYLVTIAQGKVQTMVAPEIVSEASIDSFKLHKDVTVDGKTYEYADTAKYDIDVLDDYDDDNLKDITYNVIVDQYGYLIGVEQNEEPNQYVFITGLDGNNSNLSTKNADANAIFLDGKMETITINTGKSTIGDPSGNDYSQINKWYTYGVDSKGVYTVKEIKNTLTYTDDNGNTITKKYAQYAADGAGIKIDKKNVTLPSNGTTGKVYGNDDTVYINVKTKAIDVNSTATPWRMIVDDVDSITVGVKNASLVLSDQSTSGDGTNKDGTTGGASKGPITFASEVYTLFNDKGYVIAAVTVGTDDGVSKNFAYITSNNVKREKYDSATEKWTWTREAVVNGELVDLMEIGDSKDLSYLSPKSDEDDKLVQGKWFEIKFDADGYVKSAENLTSALDGTASDGYVNNVTLVKDAVDAKDNAILWQTGFTAVSGKDTITYKNGTLYIDVDGVKGFSVSPDVKTVLCLSDGKGGQFDDVDDSFKGYSGLEAAIRNLDSNFTGHLSAVFENGIATVIIFNDITGGKDSDVDDVDTGDTYVKVDSSAKTAVLHFKNDTTAPTGEAAEAIIQKAIEDAGYEVTAIADNASSGVDFTAKKGARTIVFNWDSSNNVECYVGTIDGEEAWIEKAADGGNPQLKQANIKKGATMTGTFAKVNNAGVGLTGTPAKDDYVACSGTGIVVTANGFNVTSGFVSMAGTDYTTKYVALNSKQTVAASDFGTAGTGTGFIYTMGGNTKYAAYGEQITVTGDVTAITKSHVKVTWNVTASGLAIDTTKTDNTAYVAVGSGKALKLTLTGTLAGTTVAANWAYTGTALVTAPTLTAVQATGVVSGTVDASTTGDITITITDVTA